MQEIIKGSFLPLWQWSRGWQESIVVVNWNINKGLKLGAITEFLASTRADVIILQEVDINAQRTGHRNIAEEIARRLKLAYVFGLEFEELSQSSGGSPAFEGQATLSRWPIRRSRLIRFREQSEFWRPRWFIPRSWPFQERNGGRIALITEIDLPGKALLVYNVHLESRGEDRLRLLQLKEVLSDRECQDTDRPLMLSGDFNLDAMEPAPLRLLNENRFRVVPVREKSNWLLAASKHRAHTIDWAFTRGPISAADGRVYLGTGASDHDPISFCVSAS
jgi:endonuclease/exonuclease/phosphatase family metal-dependent hydrolase